VIEQMLNYSSETDIELGRLGSYEYHRDTHLARAADDEPGTDPETLDTVGGIRNPCVTIKFLRKQTIPTRGGT